MNGIEVKTDIRKNDEKIPFPFVTFLLLEAGALGILLFLQSLEDVEYQEGIVLSAAAVFCFVVWYSYVRHKKFFLVFLVTTTSGCCLSILFLWDVLSVQTAHIFSSLRGEPGLEPMRVTETALLLAVTWSMLLFVLECLMKNHAIPYLLTSVLLLSAPFLGVHVNVETVFLLILFQLAFWVMQITVGRRKQSFTGFRQGLAEKSGAVISLAVVLSFVTVLLVVVFAADKLYDSVYAADGFMHRSLGNMSGRAATPITGGRISRGNNYPTGAEHLELTALSQPTEILYLRGFGGGEYTGGDWIRSSDEDLFVDIAESLGWQEWIGMISGMYYSMYFIMNENRLTEEPPEAITLIIQHAGEEYDNAYVPYYNQRQYRWGYDGYVYRFYEQKDMDVSWEDVYPEFGQQRDWYKALQQAYLEEARDVYTRVPTELLPRLTELVEANPMTGLDEITAFILYTLHSNATYTRTPGWTVFNEDIAEYFLFERGTGFCEHFAVTATLMYRLYGIPARYATGYKVSPSDFELQDDGSYLAIVTDESAHAWAEVFLEDYGWTPVEVTPADDGSAVASYPGFNGVKLNQIWQQRNWNVEVPSIAEGTLRTLPSVESPEGNDFLFQMEIDWEKYRDLFLILVSCLGYSILLLPLFLDYRRLHLLRKADTKGCRATFDRFMALLHFGGFALEYDGSEEEFADCLAGNDTGISEYEARQLVAVVSKAAFGPLPPDDSEEEFVRMLYRRTAMRIYTGLSLTNKFIFKFIKVFG